jgi:hypothetical protein
MYEVNKVTPEELDKYILRTRELRANLELVIQEEVDSINVLRELSGLKGKVCWTKSDIHGDQKDSTYYIGSHPSYYQNWQACMKIRVNRYRYGVESELWLIEDHFGINLKTKCRAIMNKANLRVNRQSQKPGYRDFFMKIENPNEIREFFKIFLKVEKL